MLGKSSAFGIAAGCFALMGAGVWVPSVALTRPSQEPPAWVSVEKFDPAQRNGVRAQDQDLVWEAADLADLHPNAFLGSFVDQSGDVVMVASDGRERPDLAALGVEMPTDVRLQTGAISASDIDPLMDLLKTQLDKELGAALFSWGAAPELGGLNFLVSRQLSPSELALIERFARTHAVPIRIQVWVGAPQLQAAESRDVDLSP